MTDDPAKFLEKMQTANDEMALALGHLVREFAFMEKMLTWSLTQLLPVSLHDAHIIFSNMINMRDRIAVVKSLARRQIKDEAEYLELAQVLGTIKTVNRERNLLFHNEWAGYHPHDNSHTQIRYEAKDKLTLKAYQRSPDDVRELCKKARQAAVALSQFFGHRQDRQRAQTPRRLTDHHLG